MRFLRLHHGGKDYFARWLDERTARLWTDAPWLGGTETDRLVPLREPTFLPPVAPSKIVCVGRNYAAHARELGNEIPAEPLLFLKPPSALIGHGADVVLPIASTRVEHEAEIAVVIARRLRRASPDGAMQSVFGLTLANDVTARDLQKKDVQFTRAKGFDTFCPCGPWIETDIDWQNPIGVSLTIDDEEKQRSASDQMVFSIPALLAYVSQIMTLEPGDLVLTGTPQGVGPLVAGNRISISSPAIGTLTHGVVGE